MGKRVPLALPKAHTVSRFIIPATEESVENGTPSLPGARRESQVLLCVSPAPSASLVRASLCLVIACLGDLWGHLQCPLLLPPPGRTGHLAGVHYKSRNVTSALGVEAGKGCSASQSQQAEGKYTPYSPWVVSCGNHFMHKGTVLEGYGGIPRIEGNAVGPLLWTGWGPRQLRHPIR